MSEAQTPEDEPKGLKVLKNQSKAIPKLQASTPGVIAADKIHSCTSAGGKQKALVDNCYGALKYALNESGDESKLKETLGLEAKTEFRTTLEEKERNKKS